MLSPDPQATPVAGRRLPLSDALFLQDVVIFDRLRSRRLTYGAEEGPCIEIAFPDASHLGVWTKPGAPFICIEPWQGVTDPVDFADDIRRKPGIFAVAPGATRALHMTFTLRDNLR